MEKTLSKLKFNILEKKGPTGPFFLAPAGGHSPFGLVTSRASPSRPLGLRPRDDSCSRVWALWALL